MNLENFEWWHILLIGIGVIFLVTVGESEKEQQEEEKENKLIKRMKKEFQKED